MTNSVFIFISESLLLTFSGLRIRLKQNADNGADHGTVCNVFIIGKIYKNLDSNGDIKYGSHFRSIYATIIDKFLEVSDMSILN